LPDHLLIRRERASVWTLRLTDPDGDPVPIGEVSRTAGGYTARTADGSEVADPVTGQTEFESLQAAAERLAECHRQSEAPAPLPAS
jgi:hypothetical protein